MTAPVAVDVLEVLDALRKEWRDERLIVSRLDSANVLDSLHAAMAELIEADKEYDAAKAEHDESASYDSEGASVPKAVYERMEAAKARRDAALARVGGAQ